jgi:hypothetical protein
LIAFTLFRPGFWLDQISPPYRSIEPAKVYEVVEEVPPNGRLTVIVSGPNFNTGEIESTTLLLDLGDPGDAIERLTAAGLTVTVEDGQALIEEPFPGTPLFEKIGSLFDYYGDDPVQIAEVQQEADRTPKEVFYIPAFLLLGLIIFLQRARRKKGAATA